MAVIFSDDFNRADNTNLGANWTEQAGNAAIVSNALRMDPAGAPTSVITTVAAQPARTDCRAQITQKSAGIADGGPIVRVTALLTYYACDLFTGRCELYRHNGSLSGTLLGSGVAIVQVADGVIALETSGVGATVTVKSFYQGVLKETVGDTAAGRLVTNGQTGVYNWAASGTTVLDYDDFSVDDLVVSTAAFTSIEAHRPAPFAPSSSTLGRI